MTPIVFYVDSILWDNGLVFKQSEFSPIFPSGHKNAHEIKNLDRINIGQHNMRTLKRVGGLINFGTEQEGMIEKRIEKECFYKKTLINRKGLKS